jgi:hypothetical protein
MVAFHLWAAIRTVKDKVGTWKGYERYSEIDDSLSRSEWATTVAEARAALANRALEITRPLNRRPTQDEITTYASKKARGYMQQVEIYVRDRDTGLIESRHYVVKTDSLRSRQFIVDESLTRYQQAAEGNPDDYPEDILGAVYVGTHHMVPRG